MGLRRGSWCQGGGPQRPLRPPLPAAQRGADVGHAGLPARRGLLQRKLGRGLFGDPPCNKTPQNQPYEGRFGEGGTALNPPPRHPAAHLLGGPQIPEADQGGRADLRRLQENLRRPQNRRPRPRGAQIGAGQGGGHWGGLELRGWGPGTPPNFPQNPIPRSGAPSACASRGWWRTSTTAPCCAWTAARATRRRTRYLVSPKTSLSACF